MRKFLFTFLLSALLFLLLISVPAFGQSAPPASQPFSLTSQAIALPGGGQTVAATLAGITFTPTQNFDLKQTNLVSGQNFQGFYGGFNYRLPVLSTKLNNVSPTVNGYRFQFYITGSAGVDRVTDPAGNVRQHYSFLAGGGVNYDVTQSGSWTLGGEVQYAKLPGLANNTAIVSFGPAYHF